MVFLRGVNHAGFEFTYDGWWIGGMNQCLDGMKAWGVNVVRIPFAMDWWNENPTWGEHGQYGPYRDLIDKVIDLAEERGIYVILDCHWIDRRGQSVPSSETLLQNLTEWISMWEEIATIYGNCSHVLFDIYNEPYGIHVSLWANAAQQCVDAIRRITETIILIESGWDTGYWPVWDWIKDYPINGTNIVYSPHVYRGPHNPELPTDYEGVKAVLAEWFEAFNEVEVQRPILCGEVGLYPEVEGDEEFFANVLTIFNEWGWSYTAWNWCTDPGFPPLLSDYPSTPNTAGELLIEAIANG